MPAWTALEPATAQAPWGEVSDSDGTLHRLWRVSDERAIAAVQGATSDAELLIADGTIATRRCRPTPRRWAGRASTATS